MSGARKTVVSRDQMVPGITEWTVVWGRLAFFVTSINEDPHLWQGPGGRRTQCARAPVITTSTKVMLVRNDAA